MIGVQRKNLDTSIAALRYRLASEGVVVSVVGLRAGSVREIVDRAIARTGVKTGRYCVIRRRLNLRSGDTDPLLGVIIFYRIVMSDGSGVAGDADGDGVLNVSDIVRWAALLGAGGVAGVAVARRRPAVKGAES